MKRDMNLIRLLLLECEGEEPKPDLSGYSQEQQLYHTALLLDAGLVLGKTVEAAGEVRSAFVTRLSWKGHEFLDAARNDTIWKKATDKIKAAGVNVTITILEDMLKQLLRQTLGLS